MNLRALLRLARIPNVFTAVANVFAGVVLARTGKLAAQDALLLGATACLYTAGMVLNDYFDREVDARERPDRPIPAGQVSAGSAAALGVSLTVVGLALAAAHGRQPLIVALLLTACILGYDAGLKNTALGPWAMGACRALNFGLGLSVATWNTPWLIAPALALGVFTLLITLLSRFEVGGTGAERLRGAVLGFAALGAALAPLLIAFAFVSGGGLLGAALAFLPFVFVTTRGMGLYRPLWNDASPPKIGRAIGGGILLMPALDAAWVAASGAALFAGVVFAFALPAYLLKRWYYLT